jgi:hypothetical protein
MTRQYNEEFHCPDCKKRFSRETEFGRWIRNNDLLESSRGYCVVDQDYWIHRYKTFRGREFQLIMLVEIKTLGSSLTPAQYDTLHCANQVMRNRRITPTKDCQWQAGPSRIVKVKSIIAKKEVYLRVHGIHVLVFSHLGPDDSKWITWDRKPIDTTILTSILRFDLDPDNLRDLDLRNHHPENNPNQLQLWKQIAPTPPATPQPGSDWASSEQKVEATAH